MFFIIYEIHFVYDKQLLDFLKILVVFDNNFRNVSAEFKP